MVDEAALGRSGAGQQLYTLGRNVMGCKDKHEASRMGLHMPTLGDRKELGIKCMLRKNTTVYSSAAWSWTPEQTYPGPACSAVSCRPSTAFFSSPFLRPVLWWVPTLS